MTPTPVRQEYEVQLEPLLSVPVERNLPLAQRLWQHGWLRKAVILVVIAALWEAIARYQGNDLLLPTFLQTAAALWDGLLSGELPAKVGVSLVILLKGYLLGIVLIWPNLAISVKRLHDMGKTGWLIAIPWVGSVVAFFAGFALVVAAAVANGYS